LFGFPNIPYVWQLLPECLTLMVGCVDAKEKVLWKGLENPCLVPSEQKVFPFHSLNPEVYPEVIL
jgi:hypothetical protein